MMHKLDTFKPDFEDARRRWAAFWNGSIIDRPIVMVRAPKEGVASPPGPVYLEGFDGDLDGPVSRLIPWCASMYWGGDAVPTYVPSFGPDQFAAFLGAHLDWSPDSPSTNWAEPFVDDWGQAIPFAIKEDGDIWLRMRRFMASLACEADGRLVVGHLDLHSNLDALSAMRSPARLCEDLLDYPELIDEAMASVRALYSPIYDTLFEDGCMGPTGSSGWLTAYCQGRFNVIQCDAICLISPAMSRRWVIPALEEESSLLDHCIYHLDGPGTLVHLDDILSVPGIDCIQWVPGDGQPHQVEWLDLLKRIQAGGKSIILHVTPQQVKILHKELVPEKVIYDCWAATESEARELVDWLKLNT